MSDADLYSTVFEKTAKQDIPKTNGAELLSPVKYLLILPAQAS